MAADPTLTFDCYRFDLPNGQVWHDDHVMPLTNKAFAVLHYLVEHAGQLVTKAELFDALWPGTAVSDGALTFCIVELRKALSDDAKAPQFIETVHRRGYRFITKVVSSKEETRDWRREPRLPSAQASRLKPLAATFVGREIELTQLHSWLEKALNGERQMVFVTGEPGIGKTALIDVFVSSIQDQEKSQNAKVKRQNAHVSETQSSALSPQSLPSPDPRPLTSGPWIAQGQCIEQHGPGEPYMPILEALGRLCREPDGERLITLLTQHAPTWLLQMPTLLPAVELEALQRKTQGVTRARMLREMGDAIDAITAERPLVLWLEDLHWSDVSTLELLALLARRAEPTRLLIIGTYRPVDILLQEHPLRTVKQELQLHGLCAELPLGLLSETQIAEYLIVRFSVGAIGWSFLPELARLIHQRTDGNPLFMVTVVEDLVSQGVLVSVEGQWALHGELTTLETKVPDNLQQMIAQQIERLKGEDRSLLEVASVAGMEFSTAAVAAGVETEIERVEEQCEELVRHARFLRASGTVDWPDGTVATRYSFLHALYQEVLSNRIPAGRRQRLHQQIGEREEHAYGERAKEVAAELAIHFEAGRDYQRAVQYGEYAAESAIQRYAHQEAEILLKKSLELLKLLPETPKRNQQELLLRTTLALTLQAIRGYGNPEVEQAYAGVRARGGEMQSRAQLVRMLFGLCQLHLARAEYDTAVEVGQQLLGIAEEEQDTGLLVEAHAVMGVTVFHQGEMQTVLTHLKQSTDLYDRVQHGSHAAVYGQDPWVASRSYSGLALWLLGYPQQAVQQTSDALRYAQEIKHPFSQAFALHDLTLIFQFQRNLSAVQQHAEALLALASEQKFPSWEIPARTLQAWVLVEQGQGEAGAAILRWGIDARLAVGMTLRMPYQQARLAEACGQNNQPEEGLVLIEKALTTVASTGERWWEAELYRLKGELTLAGARGWGLGGGEEEKQKVIRRRQKTKAHSNPQSLTPNPEAAVEREAAECFLKAIEVSRLQQAKSLELRATMSLVRLRRQQATQTTPRHAQHTPRALLAEAHRMLSEVYNWFTEGFDTKDLQEAQALLHELQH